VDYNESTNHPPNTRSDYEKHESVRWHAPVAIRHNIIILRASLSNRSILGDRLHAFDNNDKLISLCHYEHVIMLNFGINYNSTYIGLQIQKLIGW